MDELKNWLPAIAIVGPIAAAIITALVTRHFRERKRVSFIVARTEDLTQPLWRTNNKIVIIINDQGVLNLNRSVTYVTNTGNVSIKDFECELRFDGQRSILGQEAKVSSDALRNAVQIEIDKSAARQMSVIRVKLPFLNPKETFGISILFDNTPVNCEVSFRMDGVHHSVSSSQRITAFGPELIEALLGLYPPGLRQITRYFLDRVRAKRLAKIDDDRR